jgi:hypothetical protein
MKTLQVRCGSDIRDKLTAAGIEGDFLEYADPVCEGPVPDTPDLVAVRARYLADGPGAALGIPEAGIVAGLQAAEDALAAAHSYDRVVLWFEHDSYDQLLLARCLARLAETTLPPCLELICIDSHPEPKPRFNGLGQLSPAALAGLWPLRQAVTAEQVALGQGIWRALRQPDPSGLQAIASAGTPALPFAARAILRHLQELPGAADGLSLTQRLVLTMLADGPKRIGRMFEAMVNGLEPLVFMGDTGFLCTVERMAETGVLTIEAGEKPFRRLAAITNLGQRVLAGESDYLSLSPAERWVGGVLVGSGWRWDMAAEGVIGGV